jgi:hypothetical protein
MNEKLHNHQDIKPACGGGGEPESTGQSIEAREALAHLAIVDGMIDDILSAALTGNYLDSTRQRGGQ